MAKKWKPRRPKPYRKSMGGSSRRIVRKDKRARKAAKRAAIANQEATP